MPIPFDNTYARLPAACYVKAEPAPVAAPRWIAFNRELAEELGLEAEALEGDEGLAIFAGNRVPEGAEPIALAYAGHQFGGFSPQLGDGRALLLGEVVDREGRRRDLQLKGSGPTAFSRRGDGRSALGPVLREYLVSEAMAALGIPTTRALAAVASGETVYREQLEPGGVFTRVAASHLRIGTLEYFAARQDFESLSAVVAHAVDRHDPEAAGSSNPPLAFFEGVIARQASLVARWMGLGFIHGVMNTDNMSLSGETIDYGPCAFLDRYDPSKRFSYIDEGGRYAFGNQPRIAHWNLARLAEALVPLLHEEQEHALALAKEALERFPALYDTAMLSVFAAKIGIDSPRDEDGPLAEWLLGLMAEDGVDFTLAFRHLAGALEESGSAPFVERFRDRDGIADWLGAWRGRLGERGIAAAEARQTMAGANPVFIPRNHRIEAVIEAARGGDLAPFHRLHDILRRPYEAQPEHAAYEAPPLPHEEVRATFCGT